MIRLIFSDLRDHAATWVGALLVAVGCGFIGGWAASFQQTAPFYSGTLHWYLQNAVTILLVFSIPVALIVLTSAANLTVSVQRRSYALWQLANVRRGFVRNVVLAQLAVVAVLGAIVGTLIAAVTFPLLVPWVFSTANAFRTGVPRVGFQLMPLVWLAVAGVFVVGGSRGARAAGRTPPLLALREPEPERKGMTWVRLLVFIGAVACVIWIRATMVRLMAEDSSSWTNITSWALPIPVLVSAALAAVAPPLMSGVLFAWTALIPQRRLSAWYLARHTARHGLGASTAAETPIMVGFGAVAGLYSLIGAFWTYAQTHSAAQTGSWTLDLTTGLILLGGPVIMCAIGASASVLMSAGRRGHDVALLTAAGAARSMLVAAAVFEALIHAVTATLIGMVSVAISCTTIGSAFGLPPLAGVAFGPGFIVSAAGFVLVLLATLVPTLKALRADVAQVLSCQG